MMHYLHVLMFKLSLSFLLNKLKLAHQNWQVDKPSVLCCAVAELRFFSCEAWTNNY
jgi:hypothetical protein